MLRPALLATLLVVTLSSARPPGTRAQAPALGHAVHLPVALSRGQLATCPGAVSSASAVGQARTAAWTRGIAPREGDSEHGVRAAALVTRRQADFRFELDLKRAYPELQDHDCIWYVVLEGRWLRQDGQLLADQPYPGPTPRLTVTPGPSPTRRPTSTPGAGPQPTPNAAFVTGYAGVVVDALGGFAHVARNWAAP